MSANPTTYRYPAASLVPDGMRALVGLAFTGVPLATRFAIYREFSDLAGLDEFYDLEDRTTEL